MTVISHATLRAKLRRLEEKHRAKVWRWTIHIQDDKPPFLRIRLIREAQEESTYLDIPAADLNKYEDDELLIFLSYRNPLGMGASDKDGD